MLQKPFSFWDIVLHRNGHTVYRKSLKNYIEKI